jgi:hypothetical protein
MLPRALNPQDSNNLSRFTVTQERCQHRTNSGRQCRSLVQTQEGPLAPMHATLCARHARIPQKQVQRDDSSDLSALLSQNLSQNKSAADIHAHLWNLSLALQQGRISSRRAAVLAYIHSLLLRTLPAIEKQQSSSDDGIDMTGAPRPIRNPHDNPDNHKIIIDMPRPRHDHHDPNNDPPPHQPSNQPPSYPTPNSSAAKLYGFHPTSPSPTAQSFASPAITSTPRTLPSRNRKSRDTAVVCRPPLCYSKNLGLAEIIARPDLSGRSAAWLARLVRDQEVEGSNPFAPTTFLQSHQSFTATSCSIAAADLGSSRRSVAT